MTDPRIQPRCDYWVRGEFCLQRCGLPATHEYHRRGVGTQFFCALHTRVIRESTRDKFVPSPIRTPDMISEENHGTH